MTAMPSCALHTPDAACTETPGLIEITTDGDELTICLIGAIDETLRDAAHDAMVQALTHPGDVTVDVSGVTFISSAGVAFLASMDDAVSHGRRRLRLRSPSPAMRTVLTALSGHLDFEVTGSAP